MRRFAIVTAALLAAALGACADMGQNGPLQATTVSQRHPITVDTQSATLLIAVHPDAPGLSDEDLARIDAFADHYKARGHGALDLAMPTGAPNREAASHAIAEAETRLYWRGLGPDKVRLSQYRASGAAHDAPLILSFTQYVATPSPCGNWSEDYAFNPRNTATPNFGCATRNNLAAMVADPKDLVEPRDLDPADAQRRGQVLERYRMGETTQTERADSESGAASEVNEQ